MLHAPNLARTSFQEWYILESKAPVLKHSLVLFIVGVYLSPFNLQRTSVKQWSGLIVLFRHQSP